MKGEKTMGKNNIELICKFTDDDTAFGYILDKVFEYEEGLNPNIIFGLVERFKGCKYIFIRTGDNKVMKYNLSASDELCIDKKYIKLFSPALGIDNVYSFEDYGKTWALEEKELTGAKGE